MEYCKNLEWMEFPDGDFYTCKRGKETSSDWCEGPGDGQCPDYDPIVIR